MITTFAILTRDKKEDNFKRYDVAHRYSLGNKKIGIKWLNITLRDLLNITKHYKKYKIVDVPVHAIDNTQQGVKTIGDLIKLENEGSLRNVNR